MEDKRVDIGVLGEGTINVGILNCCIGRLEDSVSFGDAGLTRTGVFSQSTAKCSVMGLAGMDAPGLLHAMSFSLSFGSCERSAWTGWDGTQDPSSSMHSNARRDSVSFIGSLLDDSSMTRVSVELDNGDTPRELLGLGGKGILSGGTVSFFGFVVDDALSSFGSFVDVAGCPCGALVATTRFRVLASA